MNRALCTGINDYPGSDNDLNGCLNDARNWDNLFTALGFEVTRLEDNAVTINNFYEMAKKILEKALPGEWVVIQYSGHGTFTVDMSGDEVDGYDEALFLFDGLFLDDRFQQLLSNIQIGVHILIILDSCFSGTATRKINSKAVVVRPKFVYPSWIDKMPKQMKPVTKIGENAMVEILMSGAADIEYSYDAYIDGKSTGAFSYYAINTYKSGMTFDEWYTEIRKHLPSSRYPQTPQLEGSNYDTAQVAFGVASDIPTPEPGPILEPVPDNKPSNWIYVMAAVVALAVIVGLYFILK
jgi:hypothetical protein